MSISHRWYFEYHFDSTSRVYKTFHAQHNYFPEGPPFFYSEKIRQSLKNYDGPGKNLGDLLIPSQKIAISKSDVSFFRFKREAGHTRRFLGQI